MYVFISMYKKKMTNAVHHVVKHNVKNVNKTVRLEGNWCNI